MSSLLPGPKGRELVNRWWQLLACIVAMMAIANLQYAWTLFTLPLTKSLNATLSSVQVAFTLFFAGWGAARLVEAAGSWIPSSGWPWGAICWPPSSRCSSSSHW